LGDGVALNRFVIGMSLTVVVLVVAVIGVATYDARRHIDLEGLLDSSGAAISYMPDARLATEEICDVSTPCVQAVESSTLTLMKFEEEEQAADVAARYGSRGDRSGWSVVFFKGDGISARERMEFMQILDGSNVNSPDSYFSRTSSAAPRRTEWQRRARGPMPAAPA
jgi:hypothetical protein